MTTTVDLNNFILIIVGYLIGVLLMHSIRTFDEFDLFEEKEEEEDYDYMNSSKYPSKYPSNYPY